MNQTKTQQEKMEAINITVDEQNAIFKRMLEISQQDSDMINSRQLHLEKNQQQFTQNVKNTAVNKEKVVRLDENLNIIDSDQVYQQGIIHSYNLTESSNLNSSKNNSFLEKSSNNSLIIDQNDDSQKNYQNDQFFDKLPLTPVILFAKENDLTAQIIEDGELIYFKCKISSTKFFIAYSQKQQKEIIGFFFDKMTQEYLQFIFNNHYINMTYMNIFFNLSQYNLNLQVFKSQYIISELFEDIDHKNSIYSISKKFSGSLSNLIQTRKYLKKYLTTTELEYIFLSLLQIGSSLETLNLFHSNLKISKILLDYTQDGDFLLGNKQDGYFLQSPIVLNQIEKIHYIKPNYIDKDLLDINRIEVEINGYNTPEALEFSSQLYASKQNAYAIGLIMLNLIILDEFSRSRFRIGFCKGIQSLENDEISDILKIGIKKLLQVDQNQRYTCKQVIKDQFGIDFKSLEDQYIKIEKNYISADKKKNSKNNLSSDSDLNNTNIIEGEINQQPIQVSDEINDQQKIFDQKQQNNDNVLSNDQYQNQNIQFESNQIKQTLNQNISQQVTYTQCKQQYLKSKYTIDKFIVQTILFEFSDEQSQKYAIYLNDIIKYHKFSDFVEDIINQDIRLYELLFEQYLIIKECQYMFINYLENDDIEYTEQEKNEIKFYYFKVTYLFCLECQREKIFRQYLLLTEENNYLIYNIISSIEELRENYKLNYNQLLNEQIKQQSYENISYRQKFNYIDSKNQNNIFESYNIKQKKAVMERIKTNFQEEEEFFNDFFSCLEIIGENLQIKKYKQDKEKLFLYTEYSLLRNEFFKDLAEEYSLEYFLFFDKYKILNLFTDLQYIEQINVDETILYFYFLSALYLIKFNYLSFNIEQSLFKIINKLNSFSILNQDFGLIFTMKIIKDLEEKDCLDEQLYTLFNQWNNQPEYKVKSNWINKEQIQLYIDTTQSLIKLLVIPELARFFFKYNQSIPFQSSNHQYSLVQHIIRGKQFFVNNPYNLKDQLTFWKDLKSQINYQKYQRGQRNFYSSGNKLFEMICLININMCEILFQKENEQNIILLLNELDKYIDQLIQLIDYQLYQNIYKKKQLFYTLQSLFIKEEIIIPMLIKKLKNFKEFYQYQLVAYDLNIPILSLNKDLDINDYINNNNSLNNYLNVISKQLKLFFKNWMNVRELILEKQTEKQKILYEFQNNLKNFVFLNRQSFQVLRFNIEFYIKHIQIEIQLGEKNKNLKTFDKKIEILSLSKSQFQIDLLYFNEEQVVRKRLKHDLNQNQLNLKFCLKQIINECSILTSLQKYYGHKNIIKLIDYKAQNGEIELFYEYCEKGSLYSYLKSNVLNKEQRISTCIDILEGVNFLHENKIIHGDLKLSNIVVDQQNIIKIIDFGISSSIIEQYCSFNPENKSYHQNQSHFQDYFNVGIVLFSVLLQNNQFSKNYQSFKINKIQFKNKNIMKEYFRCELQDQKIMIEKEYSPCIFKAVLSLFNEQPYLRPKLSELINILKNHKNNDSDKKIEKLIKYSIKKSTINLQQNEHSILIQQIIKKFFPENELNIIIKKNKLNQFNQKINSKDVDVEIQQQLNQAAQEISSKQSDDIIKKKQRKKSFQISLNFGDNKNQDKQNQIIDQQTIQNIQIDAQETKQDVSQQNLIKYFIIKQDQKQEYDIELYEAIKSNQLNFGRHLTFRGLLINFKFYIQETESNSKILPLLNKTDILILQKIFDNKLLGSILNILFSNQSQFFIKVLVETSQELFGKLE